jgi:preprotein translocase subunit SecE
MNPLQKITDYFRAVNSELRKVSWPTRQATLSYSALVIGISVVTAISFGVLDLGFTKLAAMGTAARIKYATQAEANLTASSTPTAPVSPGQPMIDFKEVTPITPPVTTTK